jgi:hypothetical protein
VNNRLPGWIQRYDGYVNASALCAHYGKRWEVWLEADGTERHAPYGYPTRELVTLLAIAAAVPVDRMILEEGDTVWIHSLVATALASWLSVEYRLAMARALDAVPLDDWPPQFRGRSRGDLPETDEDGG